MSSKQAILDNIKTHIQDKYDMPDLNIDAIKYPDKMKAFEEVSASVGGSAAVLGEGEDINDLIKKLYPEAKSIASNLKEITIATLNPDDVARPHDLNGTDLAVIQGEVGVAENGCVWIPQNVKEKVLYFISEYLVIILDRKNLVNNMHEAYEKIKFSDAGFGVFISGPSKTADIEQALVVGAHGAKGVTVILK
ncbi:LutC/YkgG family protein [Dysgonomonas massiliensis]|uniref:LutC/YkgG family protein n=1 Tax=Dysgonomonas massiliensis TaxID=2040292 RepID=UPI000C790DE2|nr:LUD domain-containing protein [Dysgonomonas massiliensis]